MDAATQKAIRQRTILHQLESAAPAGASMRAISSHLALLQQPAPDSRILEDLQWLIQQGHVEQIADSISPALKYWRITEQGIASL